MTAEKKGCATGRETKQGEKGQIRLCDDLISRLSMEYLKIGGR